MADTGRTRDVFSVSRLNVEMRALIEGSFPLLWVEGEISNLASPRSGHLYFSLKDERAQVRCALFRNKRQRLRHSPVDGDQVLVQARVSFYEPRGDFQLIIEHLEPAGAGSAQRAFEALKQKLQAEGLFAAERKKPLPEFPRHLGVITSPSGAAIRDVLQVMRRRAPQVAVTIFPAQVQGQGAVGSLTGALQIALERGDCDILLLTRGGGSIEDLAAFNDEALARLISDAPVPIVSAVGHEIDVTISDFVADRRAPTPSAAAELISPDSDALIARIMGLNQRLQGAQQRAITQCASQLAQLEGRLQRAAPAGRLRQQQQRLDQADVRLNRALRQQLISAREWLKVTQRRLDGRSPHNTLGALRQRHLEATRRLQAAWQIGTQLRRDRLAATARQLNALSPLAVMQRGYSVLRRPSDGSVISSVHEVAVEERLNGLLQDGALDLRVERKIESNDGD